LVFLTYRYFTIVLHGRINITKWVILQLLVARLCVLGVQ
jgi:hypothetical protein